jgi:hypothetical protein
MRSVVWMAALGLGAMGAIGVVGSASAVELVDLEIRSPQGKPFIAHVNLKLTDSEWQNPESVKVELRSTSVPDYAAQVRTRLFLQPSAKLAFLRISALEPLNSEMGFGIYAANSSGGAVTHYVVSGQTVRLKDLPLAAAPIPAPLPTVPVAPTVTPAQGSGKKAEGNSDLDVPKGQLEIRLLDQTQDNTAKAPERSKQSDLELLAKTDSALNTNPDDQKLALSTLESLKRIWANSSGILGIKATPKKVAVAENAAQPVAEPSPILDLTIDSTGKVSAAAAAQKAEAVSEAKTQAQPQQSVQQPLKQTAQQPAQQSAQQPAQQPVQEDLAPASSAPAALAPDSNPESSWFGNASLFVFGLALLVFSGWLFWNYKHKLKFKGLGVRSHLASIYPAQQSPVSVPPQASTQQNSSVLHAAPAAYSVAAAAGESPAMLADLGVALATEDSPDFIRELDKREEENRVANRRADLDSLEEEWMAQRPVVDDEPFFPEPVPEDEPEWLKSEVLEYKVEPEFKNENDTRIELASAFIEIEDIEAAVKVLDQVQGNLTPEQEERLAELRQSVLQEGERES